MKYIDKEGLAERLNGFLAALRAKSDADHKKEFPNLELPKYEAEIGNRYIKIVRVNHGSHSVHSFIDRVNGDILKAASYKKPAPHARGNIYEEDFGMKSSKAGWIGVRYL